MKEIYVVFVLCPGLALLLAWSRPAMQLQFEAEEAKAVHDSNVIEWKKIAEREERRNEDTREVASRD